MEWAEVCPVDRDGMAGKSCLHTTADLIAAQGMDPATDFRGGGLLALESLLDLHHLRPVLFKKLMNKSDGVRAEWEYPFAVAGVNLTFTLTEMLQLRDPSQTRNTSHIRGFLRLLDVEENLFSHLFCIMFALLDKTWLDMKATYMEFPLVMKYALHSSCFPCYMTMLFRLERRVRKWKRLLDTNHEILVNYRSC